MPWQRPSGDHKFMTPGLATRSKRTCSLSMTKIYGILRNSKTTSSCVGCLPIMLQIFDVIKQVIKNETVITQLVQ